MRDEMKKGRQGVLLSLELQDARRGRYREGGVSKPYPDPTQFDAGSNYFDAKSDPDDPRWVLVDIQHVRDLKRTVSLTEMKARAEEFGDFQLLARGNRLSILPMTKAQWDQVLKMEKEKPE